MKALLVIDVQSALCSGPYATLDANAVIERINYVARKARGAQAPVIFIQHESADGLLAHGSSGWQLAEGLAHLPEDVYVRKTASDSFHQSSLSAELNAHNVDELIVCGMQSDFCVDSTVRRALALGYPVTLVSDGHSTLDNVVLSAAQIIAHHNVTLSNLDSYGPRVSLAKASEVTFS
jgi:nicotinamidase-related amidase